MNATSYDNLSWAEKHWTEMYEGRNEIFVTGMVAFIMHEVVYFGRYLPFFICDFIPAFQKYKLQPVSTLIFAIFELAGRNGELSSSSTRMTMSGQTVC